MKDRRLLGYLALLCALLPVLVMAQMTQMPQTEAPPAGVRGPAVLLGGAEIPVPVGINPAGPVFGLSGLTSQLGGELAADENGESHTLRLEGKEVVIATGSAIITVGDNIVSLSQPVVRGEGGTLMVPLDFLRRTYGDLLGYSFEWEPETARLVIARQAARELPVLLDVVHLQGMSTVVLQFADIPRYQIQRRPGTVEVQMLGDRLAPPPPAAIEDPYVQDVAITPELVRIQLAPGVEASSYVLENPFRIVFDVHQPSSVAAPLGPAITPAQPLPPGIRTIVIDPGHGGAESGAVGPSGITEKELTLALARELEGRLERQGIRVVLTRNEDSTLSLDSRAAIANQNKADLFISIHLNSSLGSGAHGTETYFLSTEASDARAARAAAAENGVPAAAVPPPPGGDALTTGQEAEDLELILWDLAQSHHLSESQRFANIIQGEFNQALQLRDRGVKQAPFRVLNGAEMPAVLVEVGFLSNPEEEKKLQDSAYRAQLVEALGRAVARYKAMVENRPDPTVPQPAQPGAAQPAPEPSRAPAAQPQSQRPRIP